jgi:hypothetical protein
MVIHSAIMELSDLTPAALARLEEKLVRDLEMVRRVKALLQELAPGTAVVPEPVVEPPVPEPQKDTETVVVDTIRGLEKPFRLRDITAALPWSIPRGLLRSILQRMVSRREVAILETSAGKTGNLYACRSRTPAESGPKPLGAD